MFPLPYPVPYNLILYCLFFLDLGLLAAGLAFGRLSPDGSGKLPLPVRISLSAIVTLAAFLQWRLTATGGQLPGYAGWLFLGMALGFLGDLIMARLMPMPERLLSGMLAFGLGHIVYILALGRLAAALGLAPVQLIALLWALITLLAVMLWNSLVLEPQKPLVLNVGSLIYSLLMASVNALAIGLAVCQPRFIPLALGALLFLLSDLVLGNWNIRGHTWKRVNDVIWITYNLGQLLIVYSTAAALNTVLAG